MGLVLARARPDHRRRYLVLMYAALGLAMLTKGPAALVLPGLVLIVFLVWTRGLGELGSMMLPVGLLIIAAIVAPWYVLDYQRYGWQHIHDFFIGENLNRYTETYGLQHRPPWFYLGVLLTDLTPWALFLPAALWAAWRARCPQTRLLMSWIAVFVGVFTFSSTKQDLYIFPIVPAAAVLIADLLAGEGESRAAVTSWIRRLSDAGAMLTGVLLVLAGGLVVWITAITHVVPNLESAERVGFVLVLGGALTMNMALRGRVWPTVLTLAVTAVLANWLLVVFVMRPFEQFKPVAPMSAWLREHAGPSTVVAHYRTPLPSMTYYLGRPVTPVFDLPAMTALVDREPSLYIVLRPDAYEELARATAARLCVIDRRPLPVFDAKLSEILSGDLPQIWLAGVKDACQ